MTMQPKIGGSSPWGAIQSVEPLGPDACTVSTASHGGVWVSPEALARIPAAYRSTGHSGGGWFEEDCDWCIPVLALPEIADHWSSNAELRERIRDDARRAFRQWHKADPAALEPAPAGWTHAGGHVDVFAEPDGWDGSRPLA